GRARRRRARAGPGDGRCGRGCGASSRLRLRGAGEDEVRDLFEIGRSAGRGLRERRAGGGVRLAREPARALEAELGDVRALAQPLVAAAGLAERVVGPGDVEDVVDDLEEDAELR